MPSASFRFRHAPAYSGHSAARAGPWHSFCGGREDIPRAGAGTLLAVFATRQRGRRQVSPLRQFLEGSALSLQMIGLAATSEQPITIGAMPPSQLTGDW